MSNCSYVGKKKKKGTNLFFSPAAEPGLTVVYEASQNCGAHVDTGDVLSFPAR